MIPDLEYNKIDELRTIHGAIYDRFRDTAVAMRRKLARDDLAWYVKHAFNPEPEVIRSEFNDKHLSDDVREHMCNERGLDWFHYVILDLCRYLLRDPEEDVQKIPFHTPLGKVIQKHHGEERQIRMYWPSRKKFWQPVVEHDVKTSKPGEHPKFKARPNSAIPYFQENERVNGFVVVLNLCSDNLFLALPRGRLKSTMMAAVQEWAMERDPRRRQLIASWNDDKAKEQLQIIRSAAETNRVRWMFQENTPANKLKNCNWSWSSSAITVIGDNERSGMQENGITAAGIKSDITGSHFDVIRWDDAETDEIYKGDVYNTVFKKFTEHSENYMNPGGVFFLVGTIWHEYGLHMKALKGDYGFNIVCATWDGVQTDPKNQCGQSIYAKYSTRTMLNKRSTMPPSDFARQQEMRCISADEVEFDLGWIRWLERGNFDREAQTIRFDNITITCDSSRKTGLKNDFMAMCAVGVKRSTEGDRVYLLGIMHTRPGAKYRARQYCRFVKRIHKWYTTSGDGATDPSCVYDYIETHGESDIVIGFYRDFARKQGYDMVRLIENNPIKKPKVERIRLMRDMLSALGDEKRFTCCKTFPWRKQWTRDRNVKGDTVDQIPDLRQEMLSYRGENKNKHDDMLDAMAAALEIVNPKIDYDKLRTRVVNNTSFTVPDLLPVPELDDFDKKTTIFRRPRRKVGSLYVATSVENGDRWGDNSKPDWF